MIDDLNEQTILNINREGWNVIASRFRGTALPNFGPLIPTDDELHLIGDVTGTRTLDLACGSGESSLYLAQHGAAEVWGLDISSNQIESATNLFKKHDINAHLFVSPMEVNPGISENYFDLVISIYGLGWSVNLDQSFRQIGSYLKNGGRVIFSWEHPLYSRI